MLKDHFIPHKGNGYRPKILAAEVTAGLLAIVIIFQALYVFQKDVVFKHTEFLASVLPGVLISLTNDDRTSNGVGEVAENKLLAKAAQMKADDMAEKGYFSHVSPDGTQPWHWIEQAGYAYEYAGENLAVNFEDSDEVEEAWMNSPTHRANIVKPVYTEIGIATAQGVYKGKEATFVVQVFASPKTTASVAITPQVPNEPVAPPVTPVVEEEDPGILGEETSPVVAEPSTPVLAAVTEPVAQAATSPNVMITIILSLLALIVGAIQIIAVIAHYRVPHTRALLGTFALLVVVVGLMTFNSMGAPLLEIPSDGQSASVRAAF